jgi:predicted DNA-binding protein
MAPHRPTKEQIAEMRRRFQKAEKAGRVDSSALTIEESSPDDVAELEQLVDEYQKSLSTGEHSVPVTIRMPIEMVDRLRYEARRLGVRGYQTLMKDWIRQRLESDDTVRAAVAEALAPVQEAVQVAQQRAGIER